MTLRNKLVDIALEWQENFGVAPSITSAIDMRSMRLLRLRWLPMRGRWNTNKCLKYRLKSNSQGIVYVDLSCQGVRIVGGVRTFFRIFVLSTCPYPERQKHRSYAIIFSNHTCTPVQAAPQYWIYVIGQDKIRFFWISVSKECRLWQ